MYLIHEVHTFIVYSICVSVTITLVMSTDRMNVLIGCDGGQPVNAVIGATYLRCGYVEFFKAAWNRGLS